MYYIPIVCVFVCVSVCILFLFRFPHRIGPVEMTPELIAFRRRHMVPLGVVHVSRCGGRTTTNDETVLRRVRRRAEEVRKTPRRRRRGQTRRRPIIYFAPPKIKAVTPIPRVPHAVVRVNPRAPFFLRSDSPNFIGLVWQTFRFDKMVNAFPEGCRAVGFP